MESGIDIPSSALTKCEGHCKVYLRKIESDRGSSLVVVHFTLMELRTNICLFKGKSTSLRQVATYPGIHCMSPPPH